MKLFVLCENYCEEGINPEECFNECYGVFATKEKALSKYEEIELSCYWEDYDGDLDKLNNMIERGKKELSEKGEYDYYKLYEVNYYN